MTNSETPRLCGGIFFVQVLEARKQRMGIREHYKGKSDGLSAPETLYALSKIVTPDLAEPGSSLKASVKRAVSEFKACKNSGETYFLLADKASLAAFDIRVKGKYHVALKAMSNFVEEFIAVDESSRKDVILAKALIDLIESDDSIDETRLFYICEDGSPITKSDIRTATNFCFESLLLGVWHFALLRADNTIGQKFFEVICPSHGRGERKYVGSLGKTLNRELSLSHYDATTSDDVTDSNTKESDSDSAKTDPHEEIDSTEFVDTEVVDDKSASDKDKNTVIQQQININQNGENNINLTNNGTLNINL